MQDQNLSTNDSNIPTHVDDYQPPQGGQPFNVPSAPMNTDDTQLSGTSQNSVSSISDFDDIIEESKSALNSFDDQSQGSIVQKDPVVRQGDSTQTQGNIMSGLDDIIEESKSALSSFDDNDDQIVQDDMSVSQSSPQGDQDDTNSSQTDQSLETQNIFDLLGVSDGKDEEKEAFLDELQEVIWEDFIENDVGLLLSEDQITKFNEIKARGQSREVQEDILVYLEEILPDLEDIMMDKALELKEDMVLERISGMKEYFSGNQAALEQIQHAEELISENKWADAGNVLNKVN